MKFQFVVLILAVALAVSASFHRHYTAQAAPELGGEATANAKTAKATAEPNVDDISNHEIGESFNGHAHLVVCVAGDKASISKGISVLIVKDFFRGKRQGRMVRRYLKTRKRGWQRCLFRCLLALGKQSNLLTNTS